MVGKKLASTLLVSVLGLASTMFAQGPRVAHNANPSRAVTPPQAPPASLKPIFSNLGPTTTNLYNDTYGYYVLGPSNSVGDGEQWIAVPFTPAANSTAEVLVAALSWESGTKAAFINLYSDNSGVPGTVLASVETTKIPAVGTCCQLVEVKIPATALTAGTQYWIGAQTDDTNAPTFTGVFNHSNVDGIAYNPELEGWFAYNGNDWPAVAVYGTIQ